MPDGVTVRVSVSGAHTVESLPAPGDQGAKGDTCRRSSQRDKRPVVRGLGGGNGIIEFATFAAPTRTLGAASISREVELTG